MGEAILIAAQSGRALAVAARRAGYRPFVADLFGDADTLAVAAGYEPLPGRFGATPTGSDAVLARLDALARRAGARPVGLVLGSGFEDATDLMRRMDECYGLIGARPEAVAILKSAPAFAALCARLGLPHPAVTTQAVADPARWLLKRQGGSGGSHVRAATRGQPPAGHYLQARVAGSPFALNFLADANGIHVLALTEQWSAACPIRPYRYAGALARGAGEAAPLSAGIVGAIEAGVRRIVAETGLRGLASADILSDGTDWWLAEINPRPGATLDVLDRRATPLLAHHIAACRGAPIALDPAPEDAAATEICYAAVDHAPVPAIAWPDFVRDIPRRGTRVRRDAPLCTVLATGRDGAAAREELRTRTARLRSILAEEEARDHEHEFEIPERQRPEPAPGRAARR